MHGRFCVRGIFAAAIPLVFFLLAGIAQAQDRAPHAGDFFIHLGLTGVVSEASGNVFLAGQHLDGAGLSVGDNITVAGEFGYFIAPSLSLSVNLGVPPETAVSGTGTLMGYGRLGSARYGITVASLDYHYNGFGRFQPFVGAGPAFLSIFGTQDATLQHLHIDDHWGAAVRVGFDLLLGDRWGLYSSVSQVFVATNGRASAHSVPLTAKFSLNPLVLQTGLMLRF